MLPRRVLPPSEPPVFGYCGNTGLHVESHDLSNPGLRWSADGVSRIKVEGTEGGADDVSLGGGGGRASI